MTPSRDQPSPCDGHDRPRALPAWITPDLIRDTLQTWQPHYGDALTEADAVTILQSVGRLIDALEDSP